MEMPTKTRKNEFKQEQPDRGRFQDVKDEPTPPRRSGRRKEEPKRFSGMIKTLWKPGKVIKAMAAIAVIGVCLIPNTIIAEPEHGLRDLGEAGLFPEATSRQPLQTSDKTEKLRAYHARLDIMNEAYQPDPTQIDWKAEIIEKFVHRKNSEGDTELAFKVHWHGGTKSWMKMDAMRLHDPYMVIRFSENRNTT